MLHRPSEVTVDHSKRRKGNNVISFSDDDLPTEPITHNDPLVVSAIIANHPVRRILIDNGSSSEVLIYDAFLQMNLPRNLLRSSSTHLTGFGGNQVGIEGEITVLVTIRTEPLQKTFPLDFVVVRTPLTYNAIFGRPTMNKFCAVPSTYHFMMKFPTKNGIGILRGDPKMAR